MFLIFIFITLIIEAIVLIPTMTKIKASRRDFETNCIQVEAKLVNVKTKRYSRSNSDDTYNDYDELYIATYEYPWNGEMIRYKETHNSYDFEHTEMANVHRITGLEKNNMENMFQKKGKRLTLLALILGLVLSFALVAVIAKLM